MPVPDPSLLSPLANPDDLDARWWVPRGQISTPVPEVGLASGVTELDPLSRLRNRLFFLLLLFHLLLLLLHNVQRRQLLLEEERERTTVDGLSRRPSQPSPAERRTVQAPRGCLAARPGGGRFCAREPSYNSWTSSSSSLALVVCRRGAFVPLHPVDTVVELLSESHRDGHPLMPQP